MCTHRKQNLFSIAQTLRHSLAVVWRQCAHCRQTKFNLKMPAHVRFEHSGAHTTTAASIQLTARKCLS